MPEVLSDENLWPSVTDHGTQCLFLYKYGAPADKMPTPAFDYFFKRIKLNAKIVFFCSIWCRVAAFWFPIC